MKNSFASLINAYKTAAPAALPAVGSDSNNSAAVTLPSFSPTWMKVDSFASGYVDKSDGDEHSYENKTIGLMIIIQSDFPNELLWRLWLERMQADEHNVKIWIHAKDPSKIQSKWVRDRLVRKFQLRPGWGSLELTKTMVCLLFEALLDCPDIGTFAFASESCIPFKPVSEIWEDIASTGNHNSSYISYRNTPNNGFSRIQQFDVLQSRIPSDHILKGDQWVAISNKHARKLFQCIWHLHINSRSSAALSSIKASRLVYEKNETIVSEQANSIVNTNSDDFFRSLTFNMIQQSALLQLFSGLKASDEMFFPTVLSMLRCRNEVIKKRWTYAEWEGQASSPLSFVPAEILKKLANISTAEAEAKSLPEGKSAAASLYQLPLGRFLHPNLVRAMEEDAFFLRKIRLEHITYYRDLPFPSVTRGPGEDKEYIRKEEIARLLVHGPVQQSLDLVQRWWLFVHRRQWLSICTQGHAILATRQSAQTAEWSGFDAVRAYWEEYCMPIIVNVLYYNRGFDIHHTPLHVEVADNQQIPPRSVGENAPLADGAVDCKKREHEPDSPNNDDASCIKKRRL